MALVLAYQTLDIALDLGLNELAPLNLIRQSFDLRVLLLNDGIFLEDLSLGLPVAKLDLILFMYQGELSCFQILFENI